MKKSALSLPAVVLSGLVSPVAFSQQYAGNSHVAVLAGVKTPTDAALVGAPYLDTRLPLEKRVEDLFARLTPAEKASLLHGAGGFAAYGDIPRIGLPPVIMTDGPQGVRSGVPTTAMPSGTALAASWDTSLASEYGALLGRDAKATGHRILLGPGVNLARTPLNGRNFEYFGEDPLLSGKIAAGYIRGVQSEGVAACIKHLAMNDQETGRVGISSEADERTLREFHLRPFEIAVRESTPWSCMPAYNKIRGEFCAQNAYLNMTLMRDALGFDGAFISDWGAWHDDTLALNGGCTIRMPYGKNAKYDDALVALTASGKVDAKVFDEAVRRNLRLLFRTGAFDPVGKIPARHVPANAAIARRAAAEGMVLLKNKDKSLPFDAARVKRVLVLGPNAEKRFTMSKGDAENGAYGGSGATFPAEEITAMRGFVERLGVGVTSYPWVMAYDKVDAEGLAAAARAADAVVFVGGIDYTFDHEGYCGRPDKADITLPGPQAEVVKILAAANPKTVVVLAGGSPMEVGPVGENAAALLLEWYPGEQGGRALADVLFGDVNPSGRLPFTFGKKLADWRVHRLGAEAYPGVLVGKDGKPAAKQPDIFKTQYVKEDYRVTYKEGAAFGYRGFELDGIRPEYAFGRGLSYTTFEYGKAVSSGSAGKPAVSVVVKNTGDRAGAEVVQVYARPPAAASSEPEATRPVRGLIGFARVSLAPGESKTVTVAFRTDDFATWRDSGKRRIVFPGEWTLEIAAASDDVRVCVPFTPAD